MGQIVETLRGDGTVLYQWEIRTPPGSGENDHTRVDNVPFPPAAVSDNIIHTGPGGQTEEFNLPRLNSSSGAINKIKLDVHILGQEYTVVPGLQLGIKLLGVQRATADISFQTGGVYLAKTVEYDTVPFDVAEYNAAADIDQATGFFKCIDGGGCEPPIDWEQGD